MGLAKIEERRRNHRVALAELDEVLIDSGNASARICEDKAGTRAAKKARNATATKTSTSNAARQKELKENRR
jgi:hypothetical protein